MKALPGRPATDFRVFALPRPRVSDSYCTSSAANPVSAFGNIGHNASTQVVPHWMLEITIACPGSLSASYRAKSVKKR